MRAGVRNTCLTQRSPLLHPFSGVGHPLGIYAPLGVRQSSPSYFPTPTHTLSFLLFVIFDTFFYLHLPQRSVQIVPYYLLLIPFSPLPFTASSWLAIWQREPSCLRSRITMTIGEFINTMMSSLTNTSWRFPNPSSNAPGV